LLDRIARILHLPVDTMLPVCLGFGCTTLAVCSLKNRRSRTSMFLSFVPCSAQIPLILLLVGANIFFVYIFAIVFGLFMTWLFSCPPRNQNNVSTKTLSMTFPNLLHAFKQSFLQTLLFIKKISIAFIISAFVITILARFSFDFKIVTDPSQSILFSICGVLTPIFSPIGLGHPVIICALLFGIIAKESTVSVLLFFPAVLANLPAASILSLVIFYVLYPVCISCQMAMRSPKTFVVNLVLAYITAFIVYQLCV
jgi:ferrous iron transport protein B